MDKAVRTYLRKVSVAFVSVYGLIAASVWAQQSPQILRDHLRPAVARGDAAVVKSLPATQKMQLTLVLPLRNQAVLTSLLGRLYDPQSSDYRHFLSVSQFTQAFGPTEQDYDAVVQYAEANGFQVTDRPSNRLIVPINGTVAQVETAFMCG